MCARNVGRGVWVCARKVKIPPTRMVSQLGVTCPLVPYQQSPLTHFFGTDHTMAHIVLQSYMYLANKILVALCSTSWLRLCDLMCQCYTTRSLNPTGTTNCNLHSTPLLVLHFRYRIPFLVTNCGFPISEAYRLTPDNVSRSHLTSAVQSAAQVLSLDHLLS